MIYFFLGIGFLLLWFGSELILRGGAGLVRIVRLPRIFVSLLVVTLAMSAPELSVALQANANGLPDMALGSIIGGSLANLLLVLSLGAVLAPMPAPPRTVFRDAASVLVASLVVTGLLLANLVNAIAGYILIAAWLSYLILAYVTELGRPQQSFDVDPEIANRRYSATLSFFLVGLGVACLFFGARFSVDFAALAARVLRVPPAIMALTVVAFGTALPELGATFASARRGYSFAASTQLLASCLFNLLLVLGIAAIFRPQPVSTPIASIDAPVLAGTSLIVGLFMLAGWRVTRLQGVLLFGGYIAYLIAAAWRSGLIHF